MKKIEAIVRVSKLEGAKDALTRLGVLGMTVTEIRGCGSEKGQKVVYRGAERVCDLVPRVKLEIVVDDDAVDGVVDAIFQAAHTGMAGDGRILITRLEEVIRIRTGETEFEPMHAAVR